MPTEPCNLLVPSACAGDNPAASNTGNVNRPPPPAIASMKPAIRPTEKKITSQIVRAYIVDVSNYSMGREGAVGRCLIRHCQKDKH